MSDLLNSNLTNLYNGLDYLGISYNDNQISKICTFFEMVISKNKVMNLTSIIKFDDFIDKHVIDSLAIESAFSSFNDGVKVIDVGCGAGFPGIILAIMYPNSRFTLLDSLSKRINFIDEVINRLYLNNVETISGRAEDYGRDPLYREQFNLCVTRAVAEINTLVEFTLPFVRVGGQLIAYKSVNLADELERGSNAISILSGSINRIEDVKIPNTDYERKLLIVDKIDNTSDKYPRRAGIPKKRPL